MNTNPATCTAGRANADGIVLSRDYSETFKADRTAEDREVLGCVLVGREVLPTDFPDLFKSKASNRQFTRRRATFSIKGSAPVKKTSGFTATITYSAKATLKKAVIPDGCVDTKPQHLFVCTN